MGSSQGMDPQMLMQMMQSQQQQPAAQMPTAMASGGQGMQMPGPPPQQPPMGMGGVMPQQQMGGGKGDMNPLMMLFPGMRRHAEAQQAQQFGQSMQMRELADAEGINAYNLKKNEALAEEEKGGREAIGKEGTYLADHPTSDLQGLMRSFKDAGVDPKYIGPVLQAYAPLFNKEEQVAVKQAAQNEKAQFDLDKTKQAGENADLKRQNLDITQQRADETQRANLEKEKYKATSLELKRTQLDRVFDQNNQKIEQVNRKIAAAQANHDEAAVTKAQEERDKIIESASKEPAALQIIQNMEEGPDKDRAMSDLQNWHNTIQKANEHVSAPPSSPTASVGGQSPGQGGSPSLSAPAAPVSSEPMKVMNDEDYAKVPPGGSFIDPQGNVRRKSGGGVGQ